MKKRVLIFCFFAAVALVVLSLQIVPLALKIDSNVLYWPELDAEAYSDAWVFCNQHDDSDVQHFNDYVTEFYDDQFLSLVEAFRAFRPVRRVHSLSQKSQWVASFCFDVEIGNNTSFDVYLTEEGYLLQGLSTINTRGYWLLSEEDAATLLAFCNCENHGPDTSHWLLCDPEKVISAVLTQKQEEEISTPLTQTQIDTLCAYLQEHLMPLRMDDYYRFVVAPPRGGWSVDFAMADGRAYRLQYLGEGQYRLLFGAVPEGETRPKGHRVSQLEKENVFSSLPELLEEVP